MSVTVSGVPKSLPDGLNPMELKQCKKTFDEFDKDGSGKLDKSELRECLKKLNLRFDDGNQGMYEQFVEKSWDEADADDSGKISYKEFLVLFQKVFAPANRFGRELRQAAGRGNKAKVSELLCRGCNPNCADGAGWTALHHAAEYGCSEIVQLLKDHQDKRFQVDTEDNEGFTPLMCAAASGFDATVRLLKQSGAQAKHKSKKGRTALHWAAAKGKDSVVRLLLAEGMDPNATDAAGWTPCHLAALHGHESTAKILTEKRADLAVEDCCGYTMHKYACPGWRFEEDDKNKKSKSKRK